MFSAGKNCIFNKVGIIRMQRPCIYLYQLSDVLLKQATYEMKALQVYKFTFSNDFTMNKELNFSVTLLTLDMCLSAGGRPYF